MFTQNNIIPLFIDVNTYLVDNIHSVRYQMVLIKKLDEIVKFNSIKNKQAPQSNVIFLIVMTYLSCLISGNSIFEFLSKLIC